MNELEDLLLRLAPPHRGAGRAEPEKSEAAKSFGGRLFEAVFHREVLSCLRTSLEEAKGRKAGLRIRLRLTEAPKLANLPWEFLYDANRDCFLALSNKTPVVRYLELPERIPPLTVTPPLRVLVMLAKPHDYAELDVEQEWRQLNEALSGLRKQGLVELERLAEATLEVLRRRLRQGEVHVLHFIGHGGFSEDSQEGVVILEDETGRGHWVRSEVLAVDLHDHAPLRLAVLNVCEGARASRDNPFAGVVQTLIRQGIPAVVAMQSEVTAETALTLAHSAGIGTRPEPGCTPSSAIRLREKIPSSVAPSALGAPPSRRLQAKRLHQRSQHASLRNTWQRAPGPAQDVLAALARGEVRPLDLDFDLRIARTAEGYRARVWGSQADRGVRSMEELAEARDPLASSALQESPPIQEMW